MSELPDSDLLEKIWALLHEHLQAVNQVMADENRFVRTELEGLRKDLITQSDAIIEGVPVGTINNESNCDVPAALGSQGRVAPCRDLGCRLGEVNGVLANSNVTALGLQGLG
jgi:hypothetical protein